MLEWYMLAIDNHQRYLHSLKSFKGWLAASACGALAIIVFFLTTDTIWGSVFLPLLTLPAVAVYMSYWSRCDAKCRVLKTIGNFPRDKMDEDNEDDQAMWTHLKELAAQLGGTDEWLND